MLKINEVFGPTIQGEGKSVGKQVMFLRLSTCNLHCFKCDTPYTWFFQGSKATHVDGVQFDKKKEIQFMEPKQIFWKILELGRDVKALVISGGEPLLQQEQLLPLLKLLKGEGWWIEVETNGTQVPEIEFVEQIDQINCSPKLQSSFSGESEKIRIRENALNALAALEKTTFKFVIAEPENIEELISLTSRFQMKNIYLMPEGRVNTEIQQRKSFILELCQKYGFQFSTRLHVELWGNKRAV